MRQTFDFAPLFGSTVGFDRVFDLLQSANRGEPQPDDRYPPYDIERTGPDAYRITLAVAGFADHELSITAERNSLFVEGQHSAETTGGQREFLYRGIGARAFKQRFQLADHVKVTKAHLADGLLTIDLVREVPEAVRARKIDIESLNQAGSPQLAAQRAA
jgi:molecular chaperone IbpA